MARAEPHSYTLAIGANRGGEGPSSLRYASRDAQRFATLLVELGRTKRSDVEVLLEPTPERIEQALELLRARLMNAFRPNYDWSDLQTRVSTCYPREAVGFWAGPLGISR